MGSTGQLCLLTALVCSGYAAFVCLAFRIRQHRLLQQLAATCGVVAFVSLGGAVGLLGWALVTKDFSLDYVARYSSRLLPWQYALSGLWVGQAGSLLLWACMVGGLAVVVRVLPARDVVIRDSAFGVIMANLAFLIAIMVFAADPFQPSLAPPKEGLGLSPLLQHPSMLIHPPVVFFAYAAWVVPFALAAAALRHGRLDANWTQMARPWALLAWGVLGVGLLLGAHWAYEELGWGGYWGWDPVENGSLLPWLTGTALIHCLMSWRHRNCLKKTTMALAILTFGLCNFATFLTRSGIFSSVHAFSESPIGWMFLALMAVLLAGGVTLIVLRREALTPQRGAKSLLARETLVLVSAFLLFLFTLVVLAGTLVGPVSTSLLGRTIQVGPQVYNNVLIPVGLLLLLATAPVPLLRWGEGPGSAQRRALSVCLVAGLVATVIGACLGLRHAISLAVTGLATTAAGALLAAIFLDARRRQPRALSRGLWRTLYDGRRQYAGFIVHMGFIALAIGITGSSLGSQQREIEMGEGETIHWADREIRYVHLVKRTLPDKLVAEAVLELSRGGRAPVTLRPARHFYLLQKEWTTEVDIHSTWSGDFYTVLHAGLGDGRVVLTFVDNPMMRWIWVGGIVITLGVLAAIWPAREPRTQRSEPRTQRSGVSGQGSGVSGESRARKMLAFSGSERSTPDSRLSGS
jgi:cytochrome c-type biogenesis protein CcmF